MSFEARQVNPEVEATKIFTGKPGRRHPGGSEPLVGQCRLYRDCMTCISVKCRGWRGGETTHPRDGDFSSCPAFVDLISAVGHLTLLQKGVEDDKFSIMVTWCSPVNT